MSRLALMIDLERCIGCKSCEVACKQEHGLGPGEYRNRVLWLGDARSGALDFLTVTCQQYRLRGMRGGLSLRGHGLRRHRPSRHQV